MGLFPFVIVGFINGGGWETMEERIWKEMMVVVNSWGFNTSQRNPLFHLKTVG